MKNYCERCNGRGFHNKPGARWWEFFYYKWCLVRCAACGGDGYAKPPGWPDEKEMARCRGPATPPPPPKRPTPPTVDVVLEGMTIAIDTMQLKVSREIGERRCDR